MRSNFSCDSASRGFAHVDEGLSFVINHRLNANSPFEPMLCAAHHDNDDSRLRHFFNNRCTDACCNDSYSSPGVCRLGGAFSAVAPLDSGCAVQSAA